MAGESLSHNNKNNFLLNFPNKIKFVEINKYFLSQKHNPLVFGGFWFRISFTHTHTLTSKTSNTLFLFEKTNKYIKVIPLFIITPSMYEVSVTTKLISFHTQQKATKKGRR